MMEELKSLKRSLSLSSIASDGNLPVPEQIGEPLEELDSNPGIEMKETKTNSVVDGDIDIKFLPQENRTGEYEKLVNDKGHNLKLDEESNGGVVERQSGDDGMKKRETEEEEEGMEVSPHVSSRSSPNVIIRNLSGSWDTAVRLILDIS